MERIEAYRTFDGKIHTSHADARRHVEKMYGDLLLKTSHRLCRETNNGKYSKITEFIDSNLDIFNQLRLIKNDLVIDNDGRQHHGPENR
ncbi:hypothetical protein JWJ90_13195 [Desulfobulbus rhabdoformis]|jgi:hypothetical protein|uniref:hypothetical protein n=1 Tax=Desulfobulbus rhabdoformis TaxID=34032 RepID=UPI001964AFB9|nr:hypothetical protein [Desulfobulbus rhabdoformis]MBM9615236.1 hypothetical protein [Desulfobulbus rhabdoformis]